MTAGGLRLVVFDVDGTLVDSQAHIVASMAQAYGNLGLPAPDRSAILSIIGLSLHMAIPHLSPDLSADQHRLLEQGYKDAYAELRRTSGSVQSSPLYPGAREVLDHLAGMPDVVLGVATGKSKRGFDALIDAHGLEGMFVTQQVADFHPSKPHPAMLHAALSEAGVAACDAVMVGDTSFDMDMARAAGIAGIGVTWGYHHVDALGAATAVVQDFDALRHAISARWSLPA